MRCSPPEGNRTGMRSPTFQPWPLTASDFKTMPPSDRSAMEPDVTCRSSTFPMVAGSTPLTKRVLPATLTCESWSPRSSETTPTPSTPRTARHLEHAGERSADHPRQRAGHERREHGHAEEDQRHAEADEPDRLPD